MSLGLAQVRGRWRSRALKHAYTRIMSNDGTDEQAPQNALLTVQEASRALRVSRWTVYQLIRSRQLKTIKIGSRRLVPAEAIRMLVTQLSQEDR